MLDNFKTFEIENSKVIFGGNHGITQKVTLNKATNDD